VLVKLFTYTLIMFVVTVVTFAYWLFNYKKPLEEEKLQINNKYKELLAKKRRKVSNPSSKFGNCRMKFQTRSVKL